jgi:hypothetical protein
MDRIKKCSVSVCCGIFLVCFIARIIEYFFIRTDETVLAENFIHKVFGIVILFILLHITKSKWRDIGFVKNDFAGNIVKGLLLGTICFVVAYAIECIILYMINGNVNLRFYVSGFSLNGDSVEQTSIQFVMLCIVFNIINVWMEEGVFRGLFSKILDERPYIQSIVFIAFLFGIWHWVMPFRDYIEGNSSIGNLLVMGIGYIVLAGIMSIKWSLLYKMTGSLWMGLGDHLFNNVIVTNLIHVVSNNEADNMQIVRILIGQLISFIIVLVIFKRAYHRLKILKTE